MPLLTRNLVVLCALAGFAGTARADGSDFVKRLTVGGFLGVHVFSTNNELGVADVPDADSVGNSIAFGPRVSYAVLDNLSLEGEIAIIPSSWRDSGDSELVLGWRAHAQLYFLGEEAKLRPFALAGFGFQQTTQGDKYQVDEDFTWHAGVGVEYAVDPRWGVRGDGRLLLPPSSGGDGVTTDFEVLVGAYYRFGQEAPASVPAEGDRDGDGIADSADKCPDQAEDKDGYADNDGCPDADNDEDGIPDASDQCPDEAETKNGYKDDDGCPDTVADTDGDGIPDDRDECPKEAEDKDGFEDEDGCPDPDNDGDGVTDAADQCPLEAGPVENHGCPDTDRDGDTVVDRLDNCPDEAGDPANQGCKKKQLVVLHSTNLQILDKVFFARNRSAIKSRSHALLDNIAQVMNNHPEIKKVSVEGYTDSRGTLEYNLELSQHRADAVVGYLVGHGVDASRLQAVGKGEADPVADNKTAKGRAANRRVEFKIVDPAPVESGTAPATQPSAPATPPAAPATPPAAQPKPKKQPVKAKLPASKP